VTGSRVVEFEVEAMATERLAQVERV
jgi:hypothetical protein